MHTFIQELGNRTIDPPTSQIIDIFSIKNEFLLIKSGRDWRTSNPEMTNT